MSFASTGPALTVRLSRFVIRRARMCAPVGTPNFAFARWAGTFVWTGFSHVGWSSSSGGRAEFATVVMPRFALAGAPTSARRDWGGCAHFLGRGLDGVRERRREWRAMRYDRRGSLDGQEARALERTNRDRCGLRHRGIRTRFVLR